MKTIRMEEMNWPDIKAAIDQGYTSVTVAVGSTEQHGPHLPTMTDTRIGDAVAHRVALKLGRTLLARTIPVGISGHHLAFGGTISLRPETLAMIIGDYVDSLVRCGFKRIIFLPSHGGNFSTVAKAIEQAKASHLDIDITGYTDLMGFDGLLKSVSAQFGVTADESGAHAGENETSIMLALERDLVARERFAPGYLGPTGEREFQLIIEQGMPALTANGVLGDPRNASAEKGKVYLERLAAFLVNEINKN